MPRQDFIERSIRGTLAFLKESLFADETSSARGLLQSLDPRVKVAAVLLFILLVLLTHSLPVLALVYVLCLGLVALSRIRLRFFLWRTWIFVPLFSLVIAIPALFTFFSPGEAIIGSGPASISRNGAMAAGFFIGRVITSVSFTVLLSMTTPHFKLLRALRFFRIPQMFVMVLGICYRYIYLFVEIVENTYRAIRSRVGSRVHYRRGQRIIAWNMAHLWVRSYALTGQVFNAMLSRGFRGEPVALNHGPVRRRDWWWLFGSVAAVALLACLEHWMKT